MQHVFGKEAFSYLLGYVTYINILLKNRTALYLLPYFSTELKKTTWFVRFTAFSEHILSQRT